jgi:tetratricopeptide (TPR) repeat protein
MLELLIAIIGILLTIILWLVSPVSLQRRLRRLFSRLFRRHPAVAVKPDSDLFSGRVEILTDELLSHPADAARTMQFYEMVAPLDWDIIVAHADIERDQQDDVIEQLLQPVSSLRFVCIHGEQGSGKSTLAWRAAAELHKRYRALVIRVKDKEDPEVWYQMTEFCHRMGRHFYVLVDDLFRNPEVGRALQELNPWLPLTVLATSQTNEFCPGRLKGEVVAIPLRPPTRGEKERVLRRLGHDARDLNPEQLNRLEQANEFLVLMVELTSGRGFQDIVQDSLNNLLRLHESVYRAYEYLCFAYSYGIAIPASLLERLDAEGRYHDLPNQEGAQGLIFYDESRSELVRPGHMRRADTARRLFERRRSSANVLLELVKIVAVSNPIERRFISNLLLSLATRKSEVVKKAFPDIKRNITECLQQAHIISELTIWRAFYLALERFDEANRCLDTALELEPVSSTDCNLALMLYRERGRERDALPVLNRWIQSHPELGGSRPAYLGLVERYGSESDQRRAIDDTSTWLAAHPDDNYVRRTYLGLVERKGTTEQTECVLRETNIWLAAHPDNNNVRATYLGLVERKGTAEQTDRMLQETSAWLAAHPNDSYVRATYLGLVERKGTTKQTESMLQETSAWLVTHPDNSSVRGTYLGLVERKGTSKQTESMLQETSAWLVTHPDNNTVRATYLGLVERKETDQKTELVIQETSTWLAAHPDDITVREAYLILVERKGTAEQTERVLKEMPDWLHAHPQSTDVWVHFISYLCRIERFTDARAIAEEAIAIHSRNSNLVTLYLNLMQDRLDEPRIRELYAGLFKSYPHGTVIRDAWARWLHSHNYWDEAQEVFKALIAEQPRSFLHWYLYGRLLLDMEHYGEAADQFNQVLKIHRGHVMAHDGLALALQGIARGAEKASDHSEAARLYMTAEREFKSAIYWAGVAHERQAIFYNHLGWLYIDMKRWVDALGAFGQSVNENPEYFGVYWGQGRAFVGLEKWRDAARTLRTALEKAPYPLGPPASDDIRLLIQRTEAEIAKESQQSQVDGV